MSIFPSRKRVVVIGDIHGDLGHCTQLMKGMKLINERFQWIAEPKDTWVIQMGDQIDSKMRGGGAADWETTADVQVIFFMRNIDEEARRHGGRVISLLGNHEIMNVLGEMSYVSNKSLNMLGGPSNRAATFAPGAYMARILAERPVIMKVGGYVFCHAGLLPHHLVMCNQDLGCMNRLMRKYLLEGRSALDEEELGLFQMLFVDGEGLLWTRELLTETYRKEVLPEVLKSVRARAMVVGHNVMQNGITTTVDHNLWFVDTAISRAFDDVGSVEALEIWNDGFPTQDEPNAIKIFKMVAASPQKST